MNLISVQDSVQPNAIQYSNLDSLSPIKFINLYLLQLIIIDLYFMKYPATFGNYPHTS